MTRTGLLLVAAAISVPVAAQPTTTTQTAAVAKPSKPEDKVVCRFINTTGSRLGSERVCKTRAQWDADADQMREDFENAPRRPSADPSPTGPG